MTSTIVEKYRLASAETRRLVDRLLQHDLDDRGWTTQIGPAYRQADVAALLGKSKQAVSADRHLLRLDMRSGAVGYPAFQFEGREQLPGVGEVVNVLSPVVETSWTIASWLTSAQVGLEGRRPLDALREGDVDKVVAEARHVARALAA